MFSYLPTPSNSSFFRPWSHRNLQGGEENNKGTREEEGQRVSRITGSSPLQLPRVSSEHPGCPSACRRVSLPNAETAHLRRSLTPNAVQPAGSSFQRSRNASANAPPRSQWKNGHPSLTLEISSLRGWQPVLWAKRNGSTPYVDHIRGDKGAQVPLVIITARAPFKNRAINHPHQCSP